MKTSFKQGHAGFNMVDFLVLYCWIKSNTSLLECPLLCGGPVKNYMNT